MLTFEGRQGPDQVDPPDYPEPGVPTWWSEAKLGLFVHWGLYSLPAFACPPGPRADERDSYARHTYAEWYANTARIPSSPSWRRHRERYGDAAYDDLAESWHPDAFDADAFAADAVRWGARYLIPTTKHHDGFCLWDSATTDFTSTRKGPGRDLVAELGAASRRRGLRFGCYFSGALDWHVSDFGPITSNEELFAFRRNDRAFADLAADQLRELIERFRPDVLWNDIDWPDAGKGRGGRDLAALFAHYHALVPDGVLNDRWGVPYHGHLTREYIDVPDIVAEPWEATRSLGHSFGYDAQEDPASLLSAPDVIRLLVDVVSKNGNLLLNVGPSADGTVPQAHRERLEALGAWLGRNGEAIYSTRPWTRYGEADLRFTRDDDVLYVHHLRPELGALTVPSDVASLVGPGARWLGTAAADPVADPVAQPPSTAAGPDCVVGPDSRGELRVPARLRDAPVAVLALPLH